MFARACGGGKSCLLPSAVPREVVRDPEAAHDLPEGPVQYGHVHGEGPRAHRGPQQRAAVSSVPEVSNFFLPLME